MVTWQLAAGSNLAIAACYFAISWLVSSGLVRTRQLTRNPLALGTAAIFLTCGVHHGMHGVHMVLPSLGIDDPNGLSMRQGWHVPMTLWDLASAGVAAFYLGLRRSYGTLLRSPAMFEDAVEVEVDRRAMNVLDELAEAVVVFGPRGEVRQTNDAAREVLELLSEPVLRVPLDRPMTSEVLAFAAAAGGVRWLQVSTRLLEPASVVCSFVDITERQEAKRQLADFEARFRSVFDRSPIGMAIVGLDGVIQQANDALGGLVGRDADALVGMSVADVTHPEDLDLDLDQLRRLAAGEIESYRIEKRYLHALGHTVWAQLDVTLLRDADGRPALACGQVQDISERRRHEQQLHHLAHHDALTGLLNRRGFARELERQAAHANRYGPDGALLMLDLDHFKHINDTLGHKAGDELIVATGDLLRARLRATDVVARLGGDEFAVLIPHGGVEEAESVAASVLDAVRERPPIPGVSGIRVTASIGVAAFDATSSADEMMVCADLAMYDAKEHGRDCMRTCSSDEHERPKVEARMAWTERIRAALDEERFELLAQPVFGLDGGSVELFELLLRMRTPDGDLVPPATFLYIAERFELVQEIDRWVAREACGLAARLRADGRSTRLSINVSAKCLVGDAYLDALAGALEEVGVPGSALVLEITETAAVTQLHHARAFAERARELGCGLAIDDFGAGFGSFYYLKHLPFDYLKIDGEFVRDAPSNRADELIVDAVRDLAHGMGRQVIAEHCTSEELRLWLAARRLDFVQGFHTGRPVPVAEALSLSVA